LNFAISQGLIPQAEDLIAIFFQPSVSCLIVSLLAIVDFAVKFDHKPGLITIKIHDKRANGVLSAEFIAAKLFIPEDFPELFLGRGLPLPQLLSSLVHPPVMLFSFFFIHFYCL
jgi:hypothetical protein